MSGKHEVDELPASGTGGPGTASFTGGGDACSFDPTPGATAFVPAPATLPRGRALPQGLFQFKLLGCEEGSTVTMEVTWPEPLSTAAGDYLKHGFASPAERDSDTRSYFAPNGLVVSGHTATFSVTDGGLAMTTGRNRHPMPFANCSTRNARCSLLSTARRRIPWRWRRSANPIIA